MLSVTTAQNTTFTCQHLIIATRAWSANWSSWLNQPLPIVPQCGQLIALRQPTPMLHHMLIGKGIYIAPKHDGTVIVGATRDDTCFDCQVTPEGIASLRTSAQNLMPALASADLMQSWAGLRPKTPDTPPNPGASSRLEQCHPRPRPLQLRHPPQRHHRSTNCYTIS